MSVKCYTCETVERKPNPKPSPEQVDKTDGPHSMKLKNNWQIFFNDPSGTQGSRSSILTLTQDHNLTLYLYLR